MFDQLGTASGLKQLSAFPEAGDHVIACDLRSRDWKGVLFESARFLQDQLGLQPLSDHQTAAPEL
jgi:hypothetical protein